MLLVHHQAIVDQLARNLYRDSVCMVAAINGWPVGEVIDALNHQRINPGPPDMYTSQVYAIIRDTMTNVKNIDPSSLFPTVLPLPEFVSKK